VKYNILNIKTTSFGFTDKKPQGGKLLSTGELHAIVNKPCQGESWVQASGKLFRSPSGPDPRQLDPEVEGSDRVHRNVGPWAAPWRGIITTWKWSESDLLHRQFFSRL